MTNIAHTVASVLDFINPPEKWRAVIYRATAVLFAIGVGVAVVLGHNLNDVLLRVGTVASFVTAVMAAFNTSTKPPEPSPADTADEIADHSTT